MTIAVYRLWHGPKRLIYFGSSRDVERRFSDWRLVFDRLERGECWASWRGRKIPLGSAWRSAIGCRAADWQLDLVREFPAEASERELWESEWRWISMAIDRFGPGCLNGRSPQARRGAYAGCTRDPVTGAYLPL